MALDHGDLLRRLTEASGVSGHEIEIGRLVREILGPLADQLRTDALGNVVALRRGRLGPGAPSVLLTAHMDEIGLMVTALEDGFLRFTGVGGWDPRGLVAQPVLVHGREPLPGVIGARPPHVLPPEERGKVTPMDELFIDLGRPAAEVAERVRVGDVVTVRRATTQLAAARWSG
jgi:endoglucanase